MVEGGARLSAWERARGGGQEGPDDVSALRWEPAVVPGVAPGATDADTWWYRCRFPSAPGPAELRFDGLATLAEAWLNGGGIVTSHNMFRRWRVPVVLAADNELLLRFSPLAPVLSGRRGRPRWRTALVSAQPLRGVRTSLMGRIPAWTPPTPAVGPWRAITVGPRPAFNVLDLRATLDEDRPALRLQLHAREPGGLDHACLRIGETTVERAFGADGVFEEELPGLAAWWPHTHGKPALHALSVEIGDTTIPLGRVGFRRVEFDDGPVVNGRRVFARGACWMPAPGHLEDPTWDTLGVRRAKDAGANLIRVGGTTAWASDALLDACDAAGVLVWQDLPFANMDPPFDDAAFRADVEAEIADQASRLRVHPCVAMYCGGSEIDQQAAMLGLSRADRRIPFLEEDAPRLIGAVHAGVPYVPSSPWGGALPFHTSAGITHYYGVGAYRRPLSDVRRAAVKFTAECLGFSNVPDVVEGQPHHPAWKAGVPRDAGAGWDFEDIRDHYLRDLFGQDPVALRSVDPARYVQLSRVVPGELMLRVFAEWRRPGSTCGGALVWFLRDLVPGAGWGVLDHAGAPKATLRYLARAWARRAVLLTDEGLDGVGVHVLNEAPEPLDGELTLELWRGATRVAHVAAPVAVAPYGAETLQADALFGTFLDLTHAYRFGPPAHEVVVAHLRVGGDRVHTDVLFPGGHSLRPHPVDALEAEVRVGDGVEVTFRARAFVQAVHVEAAGWEADDDWFHVVPGAPHTVRYRGGRTFRAYVSALNLDGSLTLRA